MCNISHRITDISETVAAAGPRAFVYHSADAIQAANRNTNKAYTLNGTSRSRLEPGCTHSMTYPVTGTFDEA